jgi:2-polyprenyl-3-methyl-5-hydroxy-6-metoxy-1,4-benzoquinol methylase
MDELKYLTEHYSNYNEEDRLKSRHGQVEFLTTMKYIEKYLKQGMRILEVGAGTGIYSLTFAELGYEVDAIELVDHNINILKSKIRPNHKINVKQGNAIDLSYYENNTFDITLVLGPMYHLFEEEDKKKVITEAIRVTKPGGVIFVAYCINEGTMIMWGFMQGNILNAIEKGMIDLDRYKCISEPALLFEMHRKEDIEALMSQFDIQPLHYIATDLATNFMRPTIDAMDDKLFATYLDYHFKICERGDLVGATHHSLDIFQKK